MVNYPCLFVCFEDNSHIDQNDKESYAVLCRENPEVNDRPLKLSFIIYTYSETHLHKWSMFSSVRSVLNWYTVSST